MRGRNVVDDRAIDADTRAAAERERDKVVISRVEGKGVRVPAPLGKSDVTSLPGKHPGRA
jgi:hypothetical protein